MFLCHVFLQGGQKEEREERQREGEWKREERSHERESAEEETDDHHDPEIQARDQVSSGNTDRSHKLPFTSSVRQYVPLKSIFNWKNVKLIWF